MYTQPIQLTPSSAVALAEKMQFFNPDSPIPDCIERIARKHPSYGKKTKRWTATTSWIISR